MNKAVAAVFLLFVFVSVASADDAIKSFAFQTVDGKTIDYRATNGTPMVINVGSHW